MGIDLFSYVNFFLSRIINLQAKIIDEISHCWILIMH